MTTAPVTAWLSESEGPVSLQVPEGSYAARRAASELQTASLVAAALEEFLEIAEEQRGQPVDVYLVDAVAQLESDPSADAQAVLTAAAAGEAIVLVVTPDGTDEPLTRPLTRMLVSRWLGPQAAQATLALEGVAGGVAAQTGLGPTVEECDAFVRSAVEAGERVSLFALDDASEVAGTPLHDPAATSFVAFLVASYGTAALHKFLESYDPARRDEGATAAFNEPLAALEERWLAGLRREDTPRKAFRRLLAQLAPLLRDQWLRELELLLYTVLDVALTVALPILTGRLINQVQEGDQSALPLYMGILIGTFILLTPISLRRAYASTVVSQRISLGLRQRMFARLLRLPHSFHAKANVGDLMSRLSTDVERVHDGMDAVTRTAVYVLLKGIAAAVALFFISPMLAAVSVATVPLFWIGYLLLRSRLERTSYRVQTEFGELGTLAQESLSAHAVIKAFGLERRTIGAFRARLGAAFAAIRRLVIVGSGIDASQGFAVTLGQLVVLGVGGYMVAQGDLAVGFLFSFFLLLPSLFEPSTELAGIGKTIKEASGSMERVSEIFEAPLDVDEAADAVALPKLEGEIGLDGVTFAYDGQTPVLSGIDLRVPAGATVAIVGPSGSGKSTIINLLLRFWDPQEGRVLLDGHDVRAVTLASLRGQIGLVFQDTFVFDTTVRENIGLSRPGATDAEVRAAAEAAQLGAYIAALPDGYDTVLGERGVRMSGGQRQRLAIARALLRDPRILILDEATSALDPRTEAAIQEMLATVGAERTTVTITHRLTSVTEADRIFVLDGGRIVEEGTHAELARAGGLYQELWEEQTEPAGEAGLELEAARLRTVPLFSELSGEELAAVAQRLRLERHGPGEDIIRQGDSGDELYIIATGQVEVLVGEGRQQRRVRFLNPGEHFGERGFLADEPRTATVRTTEPTELYSLSRRRAGTLLARSPQLEQALGTAGERPAFDRPPAGSAS